MKGSSLTLLIATIVGLSTASLSADETNPFFFRDGDRAMLLGDSITNQRLYSNFIESFVLSRFPEWKITFRNTGWGGDTMGLGTRGGINAGFDRDLKPLAPTVVTIDFGMNDARAGEKGYEPYVKNARTLADKFAEMGTRVALITPSPEERYDKDQPAGSAYNKLLRKYSEGLKEVAAEKSLTFVDQINPMIAVIEKGREAGVLPLQNSQNRLVPDNVHPNPEGHLVMAATILKGLNAPSLVSKVEVDAQTGKVSAEKATVTEVKTGESIAFTRLDAALPWPLPPMGTVLKIPGFTPMDDLSRYELKVTQLPAEKYRISVDGKPLGTYSSQQLAEGINLSQPALQAFPEIKQLLDAITAKNNVFFQRWREVQLAEFPKWVPAEKVSEIRSAKLQELDAKLVEAEAQIDQLRVPKSREWVIAPVPVSPPSQTPAPAP